MKYEVEIAETESRGTCSGDCEAHCQSSCDCGEWAYLCGLGLADACSQDPYAPIYPGPKCPQYPASQKKRGF